jgi:hypothetical protein
VAEGSSEIDGSFENVGVLEGALEDEVGPRVVEGTLEGVGVGTGDSLGVAEGTWERDGSCLDSSA